MGLISRLKKTERAAESAEMVRIADVQSFPAGAEWQAVRVRASATPELVPAFVWDFVAGCAEFRTLPEHVAHFAEYHQLDPSQMRELGAWLPRLREMGLFISAREICEKIAQSASAREPARI